jgi:hypothetical protein
MGVKYIKKYDVIMNDMAKEISQMGRIYEFLEMEPDVWNKMSESEKQECIKTMCDDIFYALGNDPVIDLGDGTIRYVKSKSVFEVYNNNVLNEIITLV